MIHKFPIYSLVIMAEFATYHYKKYDLNISKRQRVSRFMLDNSNRYSDYPENTVPFIDRGDTANLIYYRSSFRDNCFRSALATSLAGGGLYYALFWRSGLFHRVGLIFSIAIGMLLPFGYYHQKTGTFLDYCIAKYEHRGLWDEDLWKYHERSNKKIVVFRKEIGDQ